MLPDTQRLTPVPEIAPEELALRWPQRLVKWSVRVIFDPAKARDAGKYKPDV